MSFGIVATVGAAVVGGAVAASGAKSAAKTQAGAAQQASDTQLQMFNQSRDDQAPWRDAGQAGLNELSMRLGIAPQAKTREQIRAELLSSYSTAGTSQSDTELARRDKRAYEEWSNANADSRGDFNPDWYQYGVNPLGTIGNVGGGEWTMPVATPGSINEDALNAAIEAEFAKQTNYSNDPNFGSLLKNFSLADFEKDPGYEFRQAEGMKGITNSASARGGLLSGAALKAAGRYNQEFASNEFSNAYNRDTSNKTNQFNRLASLSGVGQTAANQIGQQGIYTGQSIASNQIGAGNARASGYIGQSNALTGALGQGINAWQQNQYMGGGNTMAGYGSQWGGGGYYPYGGGNLDVGNMS